MYIYIYTSYIYIYIYMLPFQTEDQAIFLSLVIICSLYKWKFVVCPYVYKEGNGSYPFAKGLNGLNVLGHLCQ